MAAMCHLLSREFLAWTRGSVGAEKGEGPERGRAGALAARRTSLAWNTGSAPVRDRSSWP